MHAKRDREALSGIFTRLCERVAGDLQRKGYVGRTVGIKLRFTDFRIVTRDLTLPIYTDDAVAIRQAAGECLKRIPLDQPFRLLGVRIGTLAKKGAVPADEPVVVQGELFRESADSK